MHMGILLAYMSLYHLYTVPVEAREQSWFPGTGVTVMGHQVVLVLNLGPLEKPPVILTIELH